MSGKPPTSSVCTETPFFTASSRVQAILPWRGSFDEITDAADDVARSIAVLDYARERLPHLLQIRWPTIQPAQRCLGVGDRRSDRLVHFMSDRGGEVPHCRNAISMGELVLRVQAGLFGLLVFGHVNGGANEIGEIAERVQDRMA
jgi:hypothetical protein